MKKSTVFFTIVLFVFSWGATAMAEDGFSITNATVHQTPVPVGGSILISCVPVHVDGVEAIRQVGASITIGDLTLTVPGLLDDGSHGDAVAQDGIYSATVELPGNMMGSGQVVFSASDVANVEVESDAVAIVVQ